VDELMQRGEKFGVSQGAFVAMTPDGAIKALVGGKSYAESQFNRVIAAKRQPGSSFKPIVFLTALERGLTPDTIRDDAPLSIKGWNPENYSRKYAGPVSLKNALAQSLNTVSVRLCLEVGPRAVVSTAGRLGIRSKLEANASIALGTSEVSPLELVGAYASFANGGLGVLPYVITEVKTREGETVYTRSGGGIGRVISPEHVGMMNVMLHETMVSGTARKAAIPGWETAGKTGTSQDFRDAWFVGYTSTLVAGIWLGNDDGSPTKHLSGATLPTDIWQKFMLAALKGTQPQPLPGLNSSWSLDIPALLGLSSKDEGQPADEPMVEPSRSQNQPVRTPALPQSNLVPPAPIPQASVPQTPANQAPVTQVPVPAPPWWVAAASRHASRSGASRRCLIAYLAGEADGSLVIIWWTSSAEPPRTRMRAGSGRADPQSSICPKIVPTNAAIIICINPNSEDAAPARSGNGVIAPAMDCGITKPTPMV
jgi:membrane peptidoglycan carboxypeptidase